jgi:lysophospholipase L1-like esterase
MRLLRLFLFALSAVGALHAASAPLKFSFGSAPAAAGATAVAPDMIYSKERGFGFETGAAVIAGERSVTSDKPFFFSVRVPQEGNYRVTVTVGDAIASSVTTIKAELRRLMVEKIQTEPGKFATVSFIVNTRTPAIPAVGDIKAGVVRLKDREKTGEVRAWDDALTLEFNNAHPAVSALEIAPVDVPTVFLIGDSTVCDQSREPFSSWGQSLPRFFKPDIAIANHGESGESYSGSIGERRLDKMLTLMKPGDYMIMQFGHNDQKERGEGKGPFLNYKANIKVHVDAVRARGGIPVVVSPMERRNFTDDGKVKPTLADYAEGARQAAKELGTAFIDLNAMSIPFYEALGKDKAYLAFAGTGTQRDTTHHDNYGSYELAKCIVQGIRDNQLPLARHIVDDFKGFDPAHPDDVDAFALPPSPNPTTQRPLGD